MGTNSFINCSDDSIYIAIILKIDILIHKIVMCHIKHPNKENV